MFTRQPASTGPESWYERCQRKYNDEVSVQVDSPKKHVTLCGLWNRVAAEVERMSHSDGYRRDQRNESCVMASRSQKLVFITQCAFLAAFPLRNGGEHDESTGSTRSAE